MTCLRVPAQLDLGRRPTRIVLMPGFHISIPFSSYSLRLEDLRVVVPPPDELPECAEELSDIGPAGGLVRMSYFRLLLLRLPFL